MATPDPSTSSATKPAAGWRMRVGWVFLGLSLISPLFGFLVPQLELSTELTATLIGLLALGIPEVCLLIAAALMGRQAVDAITSRVRALFRRTAPPKPVGRTRFRIGIALLLGSTLVSAADPAIYVWSGERLRPDVNFLADAAFIVGFFVLGAEWWDRFAGLFVYQGETETAATTTR